MLLLNGDTAYSGFITLEPDRDVINTQSPRVR